MSRLARSVLCAVLASIGFVPLARPANSQLVEPKAPRLVLPAGHAEPVQSIAVTPDDRWILSLGNNYELKLWERSTGADLGTLLVSDEANERAIAVFARHDTQAYVVTSKRVLLVDLPSLNIRQSIKVNGFTGSATLSPDREQLWLGGQEETKMTVAVLRRAKPPIRRVFEMESYSDGAYIRRDNKGIPIVSPNGKFAIPTRSTGEPLRLIRLEDRSVVLELAPSISEKRAAEGSWGSFLANGTVLVCYPSGPEQTWVIELINPDTLQRLTKQPVTISSFLPPVCATAPGSTDQVLISTSAGYYTLDGTDLEGPFPAKTGRITAADWYADSRYASLGIESSVGETKTYSVQRLDRASSAIHATETVATFAPAKIIASADGKSIHVIDTQSRGRLLKITPKGVVVTSAEVLRSKQAVFFNDSSQVAIGGGALHTEIALFDAETMKETRKLQLAPTTSGRVGSDFIAVSPSSKLLADMHFEETRIFRISSSERLATLRGGFYGFNDRSSPVAISPDDSKAAFYSVDKGDGTLYQLRCYEIGTGRILWSFSGDTSSLRFSRDSQHLYAVIYHDFGWKLLTLDAATGKIARSVNLPRSEWVKESAYDAAGTALAVTDGQQVEVIDLVSGQTTAKFAAQNVRGLTFAGARLIATIGAENAIRFWEVSSGQLAGSIVFAATGDDWAAFHPSGRFDASDFYQQNLHFVHDGITIPLAAYFETFYTPGLAAVILSGASPDSPQFEIADLRRPPSVKLSLADHPSSSDAKPVSTTEKIALSIAVDGHGHPISDIRLYHNGKRMHSQQRNLVVENDEGEPNSTTITERRDVSLTPGANVFRVVALNPQRTESPPAELQVEYRPPATVTGGPSAEIELHLLVVGVNAYRNPKYNLNYAVADATAVTKAFERSSGKIFSKFNLHTLFDQQATRGAIVGKFQEIAKASRPADVFVFYYAGHGVMSSDEKSEFFLVPHEVTQLYGADETLREKAVPSSQLLEFSQLISAQKQLFLLDACQSAGALNTLARGAGEDKAIAQLARASGTHWITASGSEQFATEFEKLGHGTFTYALLQGLDGKADNGDGRITVNELKAWLETQVPELTRQHKGTPQYPSTYGFGQDFPVMIR